MSERSLIAAGAEGRDAIRGALRELADAGYLRRTQTRTEGGKFTGVEYDLAAPGTVDGFTVDGLTVDGQSAPKEDQLLQEDQLEELVSAPAETSDRFDEFWSAYPRRENKGDARKAWRAQTRVFSPDEIIAGAHRLAADPNLPERGTPEWRFVKTPGPWLRAEGWGNGPLPPRQPVAPPRGYDATGWLQW